jgi:hypothetical protein
MNDCCICAEVERWDRGHVIIKPKYHLFYGINNIISRATKMG